MTITYTGKEYFSCREMVELVTEYLEGAMPARERAIFEAHLAVCPGCTAYFEQMRQTIGALGRLAEDDIPAATRDELLVIFRRLRQGTA
jgi:predicted anti-sigma-YlaC factor YlaD